MARPDSAHRRSLLDERCARHQFETGVDCCRQCGHAVLRRVPRVLLRAERKPPFCIPCALAASGVRSGAATGRRRCRRSEIRRRQKDASAAKRGREHGLATSSDARRRSTEPRPIDGTDARDADPAARAARALRAGARARSRTSPPRAERPRAERRPSFGRTTNRSSRSDRARPIRPDSGATAALLAVGGQRRGQRLVADGQHLDHEQRRVHRAVDGDGGHRDALGHLHGGVERVDAVEARRPRAARRPPAGWCGRRPRRRGGRPCRRRR